MGTYTGTNLNDTIMPGALSADVTAIPGGSTPSIATDTIVGLGGNDYLHGGGGADTINGGDGNDWLGVQINTDTFQGDEGFTGTANFYGGNGNDTIESTFSAVNGGSIDFTQATFNKFGGAGNDHLSATYYFYGAQNAHYGAATDVLYGGAGDDTYSVQEHSDRVIEKPGEGYDTVYSYNTDYTLAPNVEKLVLGYGDFDRGFSGTGNALDNVIIGTDWPDTLDGGAGNDTIYAVDKPDTTFSYGGDTIHGGDGNDTIHGQGFPAEDAINDTLYGDAGNDEIFGLYGNDLIYGGTGDDKLWGQSESDTIYGGIGNDRIGGGSGNDLIYGEAGNDVISGIGGLDQLSGGPGNDRYDWDYVTESTPGAANRDVILDYNGVGTAVGDTIDLSTIDANTGVSGNQAFVFKGAGAITGPGQVHVVASGADTLIQADTGGTTAPELEALVHDGTALPTQWVAGDFIL